MKIFQRFILFLVSFCLFFNITLGRTWNTDFKHTSSKNATFLQITKIKKSNILIDFDIETTAEESLQEESDADNLEFNYIVYKPFEFSFDSFICNQKLQFSENEISSSLKLPLFIKFRNLRL